MTVRVCVCVCGMNRNVRENANFPGSETDCPRREKMSAGKRNGGVQKTKQNRSTDFSSAPNTRETNDTWLSPVLVA